MVKQDKKATAVAADGSVYVWDPSNYHVKPVIDAKKVYDTSRHAYIRAPLKKLRQAVFQEMYALEVIGPDGEADADLSARMVEMFERPDVRLWAKMSVSYVDNFAWDISLFSPGWAWVDGEYRLTELRHLPARTFSDYPAGAGMVCSADILKGIVVNKEGRVEYWQSTWAPGSRPTQITNVFVVRDPASTDLPGDSDLIPLVPIITEINFTSRAQDQKVNRVGAPIVFIRIVPNLPGKADDIAYAQKILKNWGNGSAYLLRSNMEMVGLPVGADNETAIKYLQFLREVVREYMNPASLIQKQGDSLGGNGEADTDQSEKYARGVQMWIEDAFEQLAQTYLDANGYEGYTASIHIGKQTVNVGNVEIAQARAGYEAGVMTINEMRRKLGMDPLSDEDIDRMLQERQRLADAVGTGGLDMAFSQAMERHDKEHRPTAAEKDLEAELRAAREKALSEIIKVIEE